MFTKPTRQQIHDLAEQRTAGLGYPKSPSGVDALGDHHLYHQRRDELLENQLANAELELNRKFQTARDREADETARRKAQVDEREAEMRRRFDTRFPGGSDADYQALRPILMAEMSDESARADRDAMAEARRRVRI